jgi:large subunit ribosomal protein L3
MYPQHVLKGKRMAGQMGHDRVTVKNLEIAIIDSELNVIGVVGAVPGPKKSLVTIKGASA